MSAAFVSAHDRWRPGSILRIDRLHVVKLVTHAFGEARRRVQKGPSLTERERKEIRKAWKLFLMRPSELERIGLEHAGELAARRATIVSTLDLTEDELREGILNGYKLDKTNATAEGLNNSIKALKRMSHGFRGFERMRRRCLLSLGHMRIIRRRMKLNGVKVEAPRL